MFVKIISEVDGVQYTDTYECENVSVWGAKEDPSILRIRLDGQMLLDVEREGSQVFYMNDEGKTIERVI